MAHEAIGVDRNEHAPEARRRLFQGGDRTIDDLEFRAGRDVLELRKRLKENQTFKEICNLLEIDDQGLREIPFKEKRDFLGLFEEVAIGLNSRLIKLPVAHYMFGYYAVRCWESKHFWSGVNRSSHYWVLFSDFAQRMKRIEESYTFRRRDYRF